MFMARFVVYDSNRVVSCNAAVAARVTCATDAVPTLLQKSVWLSMRMASCCIPKLCLQYKSLLLQLITSHT